METVLNILLLPFFVSISVVMEVIRAVLNANYVEVDISPCCY